MYDGIPKERIILSPENLLVFFRIRGNIGFVETLKRTNQSLWGDPEPRASVPTFYASPHSAITPNKINQIAKGGKGDTAPGLPPPLGERGGPPPDCRRELPDD